MKNLFLLVLLTVIFNSVFLYSQSWEILGNNNIDSQNHFIGSINNNDVVFKRFNIFSGILSYSNTAFGYGSFKNNQNGRYNTAYGVETLYYNDSPSTSSGEGCFNVAVGFRSMKNNISGSNNVAIGMYTMIGNITGNSNTVIGTNSLKLLNQSGITQHNTCVGDNSAVEFETGQKNIFIGHSTARNFTNGSNNVFIGSHFFPVSSSFNNTIILSAGTYERFRIIENGNMGLGTTTPNAKLEIKGPAFKSGLRFTNLTNATTSIINPTNKVLSVNDTGDVILVNDLEGSGSGGTTNITAGTNINIVGNSSTGYTISSPYQTLTLSGNELNISNGNSVTLPNLVNTDEQTLSISNNNLSISNGNTINLPFYDGSETIIQSGSSNINITGSGTNNDPYIIDSNNSSGSFCNIFDCDGIINSATSIGSFRTIDMNNQNLFFNTSSSTNINGKIYIGNLPNIPTTTGNYKLYVEGGILTEKIKVALRSGMDWADYVFEDNYNLMSLYNLEKFIKKNKHLPNVPSAQTLKNDGIDITEMQAKQMEKIEELTLYIIEQNKQIEKQNKEIKELKSLIENFIKK